MPLVTVLMPVYNGEKYLSQAIDSVLNQTFTDYELLIVDDCSSDHSTNIIKTYVDKRIKLIINKRNIGQTKTLNKGIDLAMGRYIARIDQDDMYHKDKLLKQINMATKNNYDVVGTWSYGINENNNKIYKTEHPIDNSDIKKSMIISLPFTHSAILFKTNRLKEVNKYPEGIKMVMDYGLIVNLAIKGCSFANIPEYLTYIRYHKKSSSSKNKYLMEYESFTIQKKTIHLVSNQNRTIYRSVLLYRLLRLIRYLNMDFSRIINILIRELKILYIFSLIKTLLLFINGDKRLLFPVKMKKYK